MELKDKLQMLMARHALNGQKLARFIPRERFGDLADSPGEVAPGLDNAFRLARSVGVTLDYLADDSLDVEPPRPEDHLSPEERRVLALAQKIGCSQVMTILENIRFLGYEVAMSRLVGGKPIIEVDKEMGDIRPGMSAARRYGVQCLSSRQLRDGLSRLGSVAGAEGPASKLLALTARRDQEILPVLGDRAAGDLQALTFHLIDDLLVGHRALLVFLGDDFEQLLLDRVPGDLVAVGRGGSAAEEPLERENPARGLNPFVVNGPAHRRDVDADSVGDLLHLERLDEFRALVEEVLLVLDDGPGHLQAACFAAARSSRSASGPTGSSSGCTRESPGQVCLFRSSF